MKKSLLVLASLMSLSAFASDFEIRDCKDAGIGIDTLVAPAAKNSRSYYNGAVQVYNVDVEEPASRSAGLAIVMPYPDGQGPGASCTAVTFFSGISVMNAKSSYNKSKGLLLSIPYGIYDGETGKTKLAPAPIKIRINLAKGAVTLE